MDAANLALVVARASDGLSAARSAPDIIASALRDGIMTGLLPPGAQLKQTDLAERFGTSVVPVREAFQTLAADGLLVASRNRGVIVAPPSEQDVLDVSDMRRALEPVALRRAVPNLKAAELMAADATLREAASTTDLAQRARLHFAFHRTLYAPAPRPLMLREIDALYVRVTRYLMPIWSRVALSRDWETSHLAITAALRRGDVDKACAIIERQISDATDRILAELRRNPAAAD